MSGNDGTRSLRAIMFTDVVNYSALMREDESQALAVLSRQRALLPPLINSHGGTLHKEIGDGLLATFPSAVEALQCARTLQRVLTGERFRIRIGLHLGDVITQGGDVLGDGVNLASRIEPLAEPGGIVLSTDFMNAVRSQGDVEARSLGPQRLKNLGAAVEVFAVVDQLPAAASSRGAQASTARSRPALAFLMVVVALAGALASRWLLPGSSPAPETAKPAATAVAPGPAGPAEDSTTARSTPPLPTPSADTRAIAVLPFVNMSGDAGQEYFSDGITEELLNHLAQISELRVTARTSSFAFKGKQVPIAEIAASLGVGHVLEGSVRRAGNTVRITAQLIRAADSSHLWSATYDRPLDDIFRVQDEISAAVVKELKVRLLHAVTDRGSVNPEAYGLYLESVNELRSGTVESLARGEQLLVRATALEPRFVEAWSTLGHLRFTLAVRGDATRGGSTGVEQDHHLTQAREAIARALAIDPGHALSVARQAMIERRTSGMEAYAAGIQRAVALNGTDPEVLLHAGEALALLGRITQALPIDFWVAARDPLSSMAHYSLAVDLETADRLAEAEAAIRRAIALNPRGESLRGYLAFILLRAGRVDESLATLKDESSEIYRLWMTGILEHTRGNRAASQAALQQLEDDYRETMSYQIAELYACRGEADKTFQWLQEAERLKDFGLDMAHLSTCLRSVHQDPRWLPFLNRIGRDPGQLDRIPLQVSVPEQPETGSA